MPNETKQSRLKFFESHNKNKVIKMYRISLKDRQIQNNSVNIKHKVMGGNRTLNFKLQLKRQKILMNEHSNQIRGF